ncbi:putative Pdz domain (Also known as dhr or glgf) protein [Bradyrhizobium sp. STM 3843]|uniref:PDZ domain-containing protein n=1 Tax=Bradyrhizobium sp. STM 3843 TaxID=551947 RepID=UPI00024031FF|nr:PDZ domain-containing protein [Bradyrhizobium sp. STM 3843]CCE08290.1 putative Pdz domain (Also known as dhr or glgf) protein [Bradyrhizobium sp. STM 3843]
MKSLSYLMSALVCLSLSFPVRAAVDVPLSSDTLPRHPFLGVTAEPAPGHHVRVAGLYPDSSAARSELKPGDILVSVNGAAIDSVSTFVARVRSFKLGDRVICHVQRGINEMDIEITLGEAPREQPNDIQVTYDTVRAGEATLRSLITMPTDGRSKRPAVLFVQGIGCLSIEAPLATPNLTRDFAYRLTRSGFVVMRTEKSGVGDSLGRPCRDVGFHEEVAMFTSALRKLKSYDYVDKDNVFIFGHSAGGWIGPLVAMQEPVKGIAVYGTVVRPFMEYLIENRRRNVWLRTHPDLAELEDEQRQYASLLHYVLIERLSAAEAIAKHPELTPVTKKVFLQDFDHLFDERSLQYYRELNDENVARSWASLNLPVLAMIGEFDIRTTQFDHEYLAAIVNAQHPGRASWQVVPKLDHGFVAHQSLDDGVANEFVGPFGEQVVERTVTWMEAQSAAKKALPSSAVDQ